MNEKTVNRLRFEVKESNYRLEVELKAFIGGTINRGDCETAKEQIKRHVDNVDRVTIDCDMDFYCPFCGHFWGNQTEIDKFYLTDIYKMDCCDEALKMWEESDDTPSIEEVT